jgi:hypothetical protein
MLTNLSIIISQYIISNFPKLLLIPHDLSSNVMIEVKYLLASLFHLFFPLLENEDCKLEIHYS